MKRICISLLVVVGLFSCEKSLDDAIDEINEVEAVNEDRNGSNSEYTISDDDYEAIIPTNDLDFYQVNSAFISEDDATEKIPVILLDRFGGEQNDEFIVNYESVSNEFEETAKIIDSLAAISAGLVDNSYTLVSEDYPEDNELVGFSIDSEQSEITEALLNVAQNQFSDLENGDVINLTYNQFTEELASVVAEMESFIFDDGTFNNWGIFDISGDIPGDVWTSSEQFQNIQASAFDSGANPNEDWLVSPAINLSAFDDPVAQIEQQINFATDNLELVEILISEDFEGNVETATWEALEFENVPNGSDDGDYLVSDLLSLSNFGRSTVNIAFRYRATSDVSPRWRIRSFEILENGVTIPEFDQFNVSFVYQEEGFTEAASVVRLTTTDYDSMGEGDDQPGEFDNFSNSVLPANYIPQFLDNLPQFQFAQIDDIVYVGYDFFSGSRTSLFPAWINSEEGGWIEYNEENFLEDEIIEISSTFVYQNEFETTSGEVVFNTYVLKTATPYTMIADDYSLVVDALEGIEDIEDEVDNLDSFGNFNRNGGDDNWDDNEIEQALAVVLEERFPDANEEDQFEVTYSMFNGGTSDESKILQLIDGEFKFPE